MTFVQIPKEHLATCRIGQGEACCRYVTFDNGFVCAKGTPLGPMLDARVETKSITARGDNCEGMLAIVAAAEGSGS